MKCVGRSVAVLHCTVLHRNAYMHWGPVRLVCLSNLNIYEPAVMAEYGADCCYWKFRSSSFVGSAGGSRQGAGSRARKCRASSEKVLCGSTTEGKACSPRGMTQHCGTVQYMCVSPLIPIARGRVTFREPAAVAADACRVRCPCRTWPMSLSNPTTCR